MCGYRGVVLDLSGSMQGDKLASRQVIVCFAIRKSNRSGVPFGTDYDKGGAGIAGASACGAGDTSGEIPFCPDWGLSVNWAVAD